MQRHRAYPGASAARQVLVVWLSCCLFFFSFCWLPAPAVAEEVKVKYKANKVEYLKQENIFRLIGNVQLEVRDITINTEQLDYDSKNKILKSDVLFEMNQKPKDGTPQRIRGSSFRYDVNLQRIDARNVYLTRPAELAGQELYIQGEEMTAYDDGKRMIMRNGFYTTCNHIESQEPAFQDEDPYSREAVMRRSVHYAVEAEILDIIQNDRALAWNAQLLTQENPAFWFPFFYIPLKTDLGDFGFLGLLSVFGQNPVEGIFTKLDFPYRINEYHDGRFYLSLMEKKGVGLGVQHDWIAFPNSITRVFFFGIPVTTDLFSTPSKLFTFPDRVGDLQSQSGQPTTQQATGQQDLNFLNWAGIWLSNKFEDYKFDIQHKQRLLPHMELDLKYHDEDFYGISLFQAARNPQRSFSVDITDYELFPVDPYSDLGVDTTLKLSQTVNSPTTLQVVPATTPGGSPTLRQQIQLSQSQQRNGTVAVRLDKSTLNLTSNWNNQFNRVSTQDTIDNVPQDRVDQPSSGNENWNTNLTLTSTIDEQTTLNTNLIYNSNLTGISSASTNGNPNGTLQKTLQPRVGLTHNQTWGNIQLTYEDFFDLNPSAGNSNVGQVKKLPEMLLRFNPWFTESFPLQLESIIGRYLEPSTQVTSSTPSPLTEIGRSVFKLSLPSKEFDFGLGNKVNFSGSRFEQRFYQTLDAEYIFKGQVAYKNDLTPFFVPSLNYQRAVQDLENNNSPFTNFEALGLEQVNNLTANIGIVNLPEFTMNVTGGYDYLNRRYQPIQASFRSEIGGQFALTGQTGYTPVNIGDLDVGQPLKDIAGNIYKDPTTGETQTVRLEQVGSFVPIGGRWNLTTLGVRYRSTPEPLQIGNLYTFGLDEGIPQGFELGSYIAYDFDQGRIQNLSGLFRFSFGENWWWHTELDLELSVQPTLLPKDAEEWLALQVPFKVTLRKDLHDFVITASWDSFYQQFNFNFILLAYPETSQKVLSNVTSLDKQLDQQTNSLQNAIPGP